MNRHTGIRRLLLTVGAAALIVAGCAKPPDMALESSRTAMNEAKSAEAEIYASSELSAAMDSMSAAEAEIQTQNGKFALFRNYKNSERLLGVSQGLAVTAKQAAVANKEKARVEVEGLYTQVSAMVDSTRALMTQAPRDKEGKKIMEAITTDLESVAAEIPNIRAAIDKQDYRGAKQLAQSALQRVDSIRREIQGAIDRKMGKAPAGM